MYNDAFEFIGRKIEFSISNYDNPSKAVSKLEAFVGNFKSHDEEMRSFAAEKLISVVNEWADEEGDAHITEDEFYTRIVPESIEMKSNGR